MTMKERMKQGLLFSDMVEGMPEERLNAKKLMYELNHADPSDFEKRFQLLQAIFAKPTKAWIEPPFYFCYGTHIEIGEGSYINFNCNFVDDGYIKIGKNVMFGPAVTIATVQHPIHPELRKYMYNRDVTIEDNVWIGGNVTILPGVTIGKNSVIGAGAVVTKNISKNSIAIGNPAKVLRKINAQDYQFYDKDKPFNKEDLEKLKKLENDDKK